MYLINCEIKWKREKFHLGPLIMEHEGQSGLQRSTREGPAQSKFNELSQEVMFLEYQASFTATFYYYYYCYYYYNLYQKKKKKDPSTIEDFALDKTFSLINGDKETASLRITHVRKKDRARGIQTTRSALFTHLHTPAQTSYSVLGI
jgi:hypothetical protein